MQEAVEVGVGKVRLGETERRRSKRGSRKEVGRKRKEKKIEKGENYGG